MPLKYRLKLANTPIPGISVLNYSHRKLLKQLGRLSLLEKLFYVNAFPSLSNLTIWKTLIIYEIKFQLKRLLGHIMKLI